VASFCSNRVETLGCCRPTPIRAQSARASWAAAGPAGVSAGTTKALHAVALHAVARASPPSPKRNSWTAGRWPLPVPGAIAPSTKLAQYDANRDPPRISCGSSLFRLTGEEGHTRDRGIVELTVNVGQRNANRVDRTDHFDGKSPSAPQVRRGATAKADGTVLDNRRRSIAVRTVEHELAVTQQRLLKHPPRCRRTS
jgi:hypothetical protein